jgi:Tol biopolymer transport system component/predicted Ser/Thr protein kinase
MIDQVISHYRIIKQLGAGGMGEVYLAADTTLGRHVALKLLRPEHTQHAEGLRRFKQEAKSASALNHPNILTIHEVGEADGRHFIATEFIDGESLRASLDRTGRMETGEALNIAAQVASALAAAHEAGIVHRDIKPENIMLRRDGYVKVLDFGLAKLTETAAVPAADASTPTTSLPVHTVSGLVLGTTQYMSPEQATGEKVDTRSDIFSLGAVLYEMMSGRAPFRGDSTMQTVAAILTKEPEPLPATTDPEVAKVVLRCLRKDAARRYQTMADLKVALEDIRESSSAKRVLHAQSRRRWVWAALLPFVLGAGFFAWRAWRGLESTEPLRAVPLTTERGVARYPVFSPEGDRVAFTWTGVRQDNPDIYVQQIGSGSPLQLTRDPGNDFNPVWSPDGRWIAFLRSQSEAGRSELRLIPPLGGSERKLADLRVRGGTLVTPPYLAWCADGSCLIATDSPGEGKPDALFKVSLETGEKSQLTHPEPPALGDSNPAVSFDGRWLIFRRNAGLFVGELYLLALQRGTTAAGEARRLTPATLNADHPTWMPNDKQILFSARGSLWKLDIEGEAAPARLPFVGEYGLMPAVSRAQPGRPSQLVYVRSFEDANIWRLETSALGIAPPSAPSVAIASTRHEDMPQLSPDGSRVAFTSDRSGDWEIWVTDLARSNPVALTSMRAVAAGYPHWSPNGEQIAFHSNLESQWDVYTIPAAGGKPHRVTADPALDALPSFSRDGKWIYFCSNRTGEQHQTIWKVPAAGGEAIQVTRSAGQAPLESPDGAYLYYVETLDRPSALWRLPVAGGAAEKVLDGVYLANYVVLTRGIYYIDRPSGQSGIHYVDLPVGETRLQYFDFATRKSTTVARNLGNVDLPLTASADGRTILYPRIDSSVNDLMLVANFR